MILTIFEDITGETLARVTHEVAGVSDEPIEIRIASYGGELLQAVAIIDVLRSTGCRTVCDVVGFAASAAAIIALSCDEVRMSPLGSLMLHSAWSEDECDDEGIARCNALQLQIIQKRSPKLGKELFKQDNWFNADQALALGLVDKILTQDAGVQASTARYAAYVSTEAIMARIKAEDAVSVEELVEQVQEEEEKKEQEQEEDQIVAEEPQPEPSIIDVVEQLIQRVQELEQRIAQMEAPSEQPMEAECSESDDDKERVNAMLKSLIRPQACAPVATAEPSRVAHKVDYKQFKSFING